RSTLRRRRRSTLRRRRRSTLRRRRRSTLRRRRLFNWFNYENIAVHLVGLVVTILGHNAEFKFSGFFRSREREGSVSTQLDLLVELAINDHTDDGASRSIDEGTGDRFTRLNFGTIFYGDGWGVDMQLQRVALNVALVEDI